MYVNIAFFVMIIIYSLYAMYRVNVTNNIIRLCSSIISLAVAISANQAISRLIAKSVEILQLDTNNEYILGLEVLYYKTTAFIIAYIFTYAILIVLTNILNISNYVKIKDLYSLRLLLGFLNVFIFAIISMNVFLSSPLGLIHADKLSYTLGELLGMDNIMSTVTYDYSLLKAYVNNNIHIGIPDMNLSLLEYLEANDYVSKKEIGQLVYNSNLLSDKILAWINSK